MSSIVDIRPTTHIIHFQLSESKQKKMMYRRSSSFLIIVLALIAMAKSASSLETESVGTVRIDDVFHDQHENSISHLVCQFTLRSHVEALKEDA